MTYTFKLARRLAVSRNFAMLPALLLFAACSGDATAPDSANPPAPGNLIPVAVRIKPSTVTLETNQLIQFLAQSHTSAGDPVAAAVTWRTTGGTILPDGRFSAAVIGTFKVIVRNRVPSGVQADTSTVRVVRRLLGLTAIVVTPATATLKPGAEQTFTAMGRRRVIGTLVPMGVNWRVTGGGSIDAGGTYVAGDTGGTYQVIAANTAGTLADTSTITIDAPPPPASPPPAPPPPPPPPPAPVVSQVTLMPATATLVTATTRQFQAYGRTTAGDSVAVSVVFSANGGTVTPNGLYTAGPSAGTFRVIASSGALADTSVVTVKAALGSGNPTGIMFGSWECTAPNNLGPFNLCIRSAGSWIEGELAALRLLKGQLMLSQGGYEKFKTNGIYDPAKYYAWLQTLTPYVAAWKPYLDDGTLMGVQVIDDVGTMNWGGVAITKAQQDEMAKWWKQLIPGITTFTREKATGLTGYPWAYLDASITQYNARYMGDVTAWRDSNVVAARAAKLGLAFSLNVLDGGKLVSGCYPGSNSAYCSMTPDEVRTYGAVQAAAPEACGLVSWRTNAAYQALPGVTDALRYVGGLAASHPASSCRVR